MSGTGVCDEHGEDGVGFLNAGAAGRRVWVCWVHRGAQGWLAKRPGLGGGMRACPGSRALRSLRTYRVGRSFSGIFLYKMSGFSVE